MTSLIDNTLELDSKRFPLPWNPDIFIQRCSKLLAQLPNSSAFVLEAAPEVSRNRDSHYPYRQDSHFYYLSGFDEPEAIFILLKDHQGSTQRYLLCRPKNAERELWEGTRWGTDAAKEHFQFDEVLSIDHTESYLKTVLAQIKHLFTNLSEKTIPTLSTLLPTLIQTHRRVNRYFQHHDAIPYIESLRLRKDSTEIDIMRHAARISADAHRHAMAYTRPELYEYQIEGYLSQRFYQHGAQAVAYPSIVAGGANACILHYRTNNARLKSGEMLLIDAGCEFAYYASDITRTFPINGQFSAAQRELYQLVLHAQETAIASLTVGMTWERYQSITLETMVQGLIDIGLCEGSVESVIGSGDYKRFYMHRAGHWLGLDVHDAGSYLDASSNTQKDNSTQLAEGMVLTVEPGCYVRPDANVPKEFWNIGIRIEDDVLITSSGCEVLSRDVPKSIEAIESLVGSAYH